MPFAFVIPWLEVLIAAYLILGFMARLGAAGAAILLVMFIVALADALASGNTAHACGCFGSGLGSNPVVSALAGGNAIGWWDVIRDAILLGCSLVIVCLGAGRFAVGNPFARSCDEQETSTWTDA